MTIEDNASDSALIRAPLPIAPFIFARRWDGLGARLGAILNARAMAEALGAEFRFIWPRGDRNEIGDQRQVFGEAFLSAHEIQDADLTDRHIRRLELHETPLEGRPSPVINAAAALEVSECFGIVALPTEDPSVAAARFRAGLNAIEWSTETRELIDVIRRNPEVRDLSAVHVRAGDIVTGDWRHFMAYEKYVPMPFIEAAIAKLSENGKKPVLILSDSDACIAYLRKRHRQARVSRDICPGYDSLGELHRAVADILILSRCRAIVGPKSSAFSHLGANLGGATLVGADRFAPEGEEARTLSRWIEQARRPPADWLRPFLSRDICWYLDVFGETVRRPDRLALADRATQLEPDFVAALTRKARLHALSGRHRQARSAARQAIRRASSVKVHPDPLLEALATGIAAGCLALLEASRRTRRRRLGKLRLLLERCRALAPYQMDWGGILQNLSYQIAALEWAAQPGDKRSPDGPGEPPPQKRIAGLYAYRNETGFDPVRRDLERISTRISRAVGGRRLKRKSVRRRPGARRLGPC